MRISKHFDISTSLRVLIKTARPRGYLDMVLSWHKVDKERRKMEEQQKLFSNSVWGTSCGYGGVSFTLRTNNGTQYFLAFQSNTDTIRKFKIKKSFFFVCLSVLTITVGSLCVHRKETFDSNPDLRTLCAHYKRIQSTAGELFKKIHAERPLRVYIGSS